jgi:hypothetical protein
MLDLRVPTGFYFSIVGLILLAVSALGTQDTNLLTDANVNLYCGLAMLAFGLAMLALSRLSKYEES